MFPFLVDIKRYCNNVLIHVPMKCQNEKEGAGESVIGEEKGEREDLKEG
jgi:hypothetical protein